MGKLASIFGNRLKISVFGQSHSKAIGVVIDGLPAGLAVDMDALSAFMSRRAPGRGALSTARSEADEPEALSGFAHGGTVTCGAPLALVIRNADTRSADYRGIADIPRPSHADYAAHVKYGGWHDVAGGGHFSGRLTAPLCAAGGICLQALRFAGIHVGAHVLSIGRDPEARDDPFDPVGVSTDDFAAALRNDPAALSCDAAEAMRRAILEAKARQDSVGGIIECAAVGAPAGLGDPMFDGIENRVAAAVFGIPGVKGIEFGSGFAGAASFGSENNDAMYMGAAEYGAAGCDCDSVAGAVSRRVLTRTNNSGGVTGGITNGMPMLFRAAFKPTPSIGLTQRSVSLSRRENVALTVAGRHDPCIVPRAVPCVEAAAAIAIYDAFLGRSLA